MRIAAISIALGTAILCASLGGLPGAAAREPKTAPKTHAIPPPEARVDINHASVTQLMKVPGMTHAWAGRIVRFRPYYAKNALLLRGVVPDAVYDRIKDYIIAHRKKKK